MKFTPLENIPLDYDPTKVKGVFNPMVEDFKCLYAGKDMTLKSSEASICTEPVANHLAKHLADKICREKNIELLQEKHEGLDDAGREKWRTNEQHLVTRDDVKKVAGALLFDAQVGGPAPDIKMPATKFDPLLEKVKADKKAKKVKADKKDKEDE